MSKDDVSIFQLRLLSINFKIYMHSCYALLLLQKVYGQLIGSNLHPTYHQSADSASADVGLHVCFCNYKYSYNHHIAFCLSINLVVLTNLITYNLQSRTQSRRYYINLRIGFETTSNITGIHWTLNVVIVYLMDEKNNIYYHISAHFTNNILLGVFQIE